jgi:hypothetical protein
VKAVALVAVRSIAVVVLGGAVTAIALFGVTSQAPTYGYLGPLCAQHVAGPGFDPWTGEPHGRIFTMPVGSWDGCLTGQAVRTIKGEVPAELIDRLAVPLPVGFALGAFIALIWLTARSITEADRRTSAARWRGGTPLGT